MSSRHDLTLQQKVELINDNVDGNGLSQRKFEHLVECDIKEQYSDYDDDDDSDRMPTESPPTITEAMKMIRKLHLLATTQEPQLHQLVNELESKLTGVYIHLKPKRQTILEDFFKQN
ncbi:unnamed protein product [Rotaria magnacalcarata]|uniref:Uncharacterized protein n=5 Tax=Rotaria magnacalcarata TaxID=392030 RepID=A0A820IMB4_9BILA|nr:unnamed protein product [Rotaria magnacalcarata]CAF4313357.1 unnamed protein product [Rotaria magnacalcarata]